MSGPAQVTFVVPCFNEERRIDINGYDHLAALPFVDLLLVDDGSADQTVRVLRTFAEQDPDHVRVLQLGRNRGKAEAVRLGLLAALEGGPTHVGYADADLATPVDEIRRLVDIAVERPDVDLVMGARVALLGRRIERSVVRHFAGRIFATASSLILGVRVYDTQCGAKVFRTTPALRRALEEPFCSRWAFDVELIGRILGASGRPRSEASAAMVEIPLEEWYDVAGSHMGAGSALRSGLDLLRIGYRLRVKAPVVSRFGGRR